MKKLSKWIGNIPFYFAFKSDFLDGIVDDKTKYLWTYKRQNAKNDVCLRSEVAFRLPFFLENTDE